MRYVVTGAAGFIGSHLAEALQSAGHEVLGIDCFTDYYDPRAEGAEREQARRAPARPRRATSSTSRTADGVFHLAGQPGVRSFGDVFPLYVSGTCSRASGSSRPRPSQASASSSPPRRPSTARRSGTRRPRTTPPRPISRTGSRSWPASTSPGRPGASFGLDASSSATSTPTAPGSDRTWRSPRCVEALLAGRPFTLFGDGERAGASRTSATSSRRRIARDGARPQPARSTTSAAGRRRR